MRKSGKVIFSSTIRIFFLIVICALFLGLNFLFSLKVNLIIDEKIVLLLVTLVFLLVFILSITGKRLRGEIYSGTSYSLIFIAFCICYAILPLGMNLAEFCFPISFLTIVLSCVFDTGLSIGFGVYFLVVLNIINSISDSAFFSYLLICVITAFLSGYLKEYKFKNKILIGIILSFSIILISVLFVYLKEYILPESILLGIIINAVICGIFLMFVYNNLYGFFSKDRHRSYETIIDENYPLLLEIKRLSNLEYLHAIKVANLCGECADLIGADKMLSMAGGLYYHGVNAYPSLDDRGFNKILNNRCFPPEVIVLISEKGIEGRNPSFKESAIVHMCDNIITKFEAIKGAIEGTWNTNMMVYQTLNDFSSKGIYDKSKLSMNEFLKIRDLLANKVYK